MALVFRNLDVSPDDPVEEWGFEGLLTAVDRGGIADWRRIAAAVRRDPHGEVAATVIDVADVAEDSGAAAALVRLVALAREHQDADERRAVAEELTALWRASGLDQAAYARRLGTSRTRLNTYLNGRTVPRATVLVRARRMAEAHEARAGDAAHR